MRFLVASLLICLSGSVWAIQPFGATPAEEQMCRLRFYSRLGASPENDRSMNHYCYGLYHLDRARAEFKSPADRRYYLSVAIQEFDYVFGHTAAGYHMRPEVHLEKGRALRMLDRKAEGARELLQAAQAGLHSVDLYLLLSDHYKETKDVKTALETAQEGLRHNPASRGLQRRYKELGGGEPFPEPYAKQESKLTTESGEANAVQETINDVPLPAESQAPELPTEESPFGNSTNPWCRFCPIEGAVPNPASSKPPTSPTTGP